NNKNESDLVRATAAEGLGELAGIEVIDFLLDILYNRIEDWRVRCAAVRGLSFVQDNRASAAIERSLRDLDYSVRRNAVDAVKEWVASGKLAKEEAIEWLITAMRGYVLRYGGFLVFYTRAQIIMLLASIGTESAIKSLLQIQYSYSARIREYVAYALGELSGKMTNSQKDYVMRRLWWQLTDYWPIVYSNTYPAAQAFVALEKITNQYISDRRLDLFPDD
ncbi:MAG TPA: HEAT repeat domain-containing protein, partial [Caldilineaceae bacterium]|nr:HEAT repeat domain-containing protein [Caldilineaceae bacterium]